VKLLFSYGDYNWLAAVWFGSSSRPGFCYCGTKNFIRAKEGYVAGNRADTLKFILVIWFDQHATVNSE
jgi:hypothetical protein